MASQAGTVKDLRFFLVEFDFSLVAPAWCPLRAVHTVWLVGFRNFTEFVDCVICSFSLPRSDSCNCPGNRQLVWVRVRVRVRHSFQVVWSITRHHKLFLQTKKLPKIPWIILSAKKYYR
ncbi:unnamed protein product [Discosporangium mesarthrocarpum]